MHNAQHSLEHCRIVEIEIRLMSIEAMPIVGLGLRVPCPVRALAVDENDTRATILLIIVGPDIEISLARARWRQTGPLEPLMLIGGMIDDEFGDDPDTQTVRFVDQAFHVIKRAVLDGTLWRIPA